ncbi:hypothetical protein [Amaricoccus sp.]|uniref:hypothetical protein n=1 Tax=Amaricoccus sp. TaxID=1872485 RepID=UPI001B605F39|nr:hypothetical protein [Amaricoccus sp.]MBP7243285.1 hypothetical protein [Amaricoccus sp.]
MRPTTVRLAALALLGTAPLAMAQSGGMSFFVTSVGLGDGANLGGLAGADAHCAALAEAAGVTGKVWAAYLSTSAVDARDRIGTGPWVNARGETIADDVASLHGEGNNLTKETALDEKGEVIAGRGDDPNRHDVLTGSLADGTRAPETCQDWTSSGPEGAAIVGHHDRAGPETLPTGTSWNAAHATRGGCGQEALRGTGGDGLFYCFAVE